MVDVSPKPETVREAVAHAVLRMRPATLRAVQRGNAPKGDVFGVARTAGILAAKRTPELIPLCHPLRLTRVDVSFEPRVRRGEVIVQARVRTVDKTGVEMEALTAASVAALTVYDMVKALERGVTITKLQLLEKSGGKSGDWTRAPESKSRKQRSRQPSSAGHPRSYPPSRAPLQ
jgi:cyclic pyranopterin phosphate synthase